MKRRWFPHDTQSAALWLPLPHSIVTVATISADRRLSVAAIERRLRAKATFSIEVVALQRRLSYCNESLTDPRECLRPKLQLGVSSPLAEVTVEGRFPGKRLKPKPPFIIKILQTDA